MLIEVSLAVDRTGYLFAVLTLATFDINFAMAIVHNSLIN